MKKLIAGLLCGIMMVVGLVGCNMSGDTNDMNNSSEMLTSDSAMQDTTSANQQ